MQRHLIPELMDAPDVDPAEHRRALAGLRRINAISFTAHTMARPILAFAKRQQLKSLRMIDFAAGGGEVAIDVASRLVRAGTEVHLTLLDQSMTGLHDAPQRAEKVGVKADIQITNAIEKPPAGTYDVVTCGLFLHHLHEADVIRVLSNMRACCRGLIVVSDLVRSRPGWWAAYAGCHLLSRSYLVHHDGPASVRGALTRGELHELARTAGLQTATVRAAWPWRMLLECEC
jgi:2-polyprenyl-3-methyl-5-hydroxy-6-metoxy-1,4-benzoquinol methylase